jgi:hypothetical protein
MKSKPRSANTSFLGSTFLTPIVGGTFLASYINVFTVLPVKPYTILFPVQQQDTSLETIEPWECLFEPWIVLVVGNFLFKL